MKKTEHVLTYLEAIEKVVEKALKNADVDKSHLLNLKKNIRLYKKESDLQQNFALAQ